LGDEAMIKILIADDHAIVREGLKQIVAPYPDMRVEGEARNAQEAIELVKNDDWDVVVLDLNMPGRSGLELLKELKQERPKLAVLILSAHPEEQYGVRVLRAGAAGFMNKETAPAQLVGAIRKVVHGGKYVSQALAEKLAVQLDEHSQGPIHEILSDREYQILCMIASGKTVTEIGAELSLSVKTISTYRARVLEKLNMKSNAELTRYAIENGLPC
jgi:two-component system invasion response regulator UvrY